MEKDTFYILAEKRYSSYLQKTLDELVTKETLQVANRERTFSVEQPVLMYGINSYNGEALPQYSEYNSFHFVNKTVLDIFEQYEINVNVVGELSKEEIPNGTALLIRNVRFI